MSTHTDNIRRMTELEAERDAALEQVIYWRERAVAAEGREQALAAHVERARPMVEAYRGRLGGALWSMDDEEAGYAKDAEGWLSTNPTTSLARMRDERAQAIQRAVKQARRDWAREDKAAIERRDLLKQAEALSEMIAAIPFSEELAREMLKHKRDELRRQAEESNQ